MNQKGALFYETKFISRHSPDEAHSNHLAFAQIYDK